MTTPATPVWQRLRRIVGELGLLVTAQAAIDRLLSSLTGGRARYISYALMAQPVGAGAFSNVRADIQTLLRELGPGDAMAAAMPRPADINRQRWASGGQCLAATVKGEFAEMIRIARGQYDEDEVRCLYTLADVARSVWDYDVFVEPRYRAGRLLAQMWQAADAHLAAQGVRWSFSRISLLNPGSMAAHQRMGARRVGLAVFLVLGPVQLSLFSVAPFVHLGVTCNQRPRVRLLAPG